MTKNFETRQWRFVLYDKVKEWDFPVNLSDAGYNSNLVSAWLLSV